MPLSDHLERNLLEIPIPASGRVDVYSGVARLSGATWASEVRLRGHQPTAALVIIHPTANFLGHYALPTLAELGVGAIGLTTRYIGNDSNLNVENCLLDIAATVGYLRARGYEKVVLVGNSGGGTVVPYYQAQAERPTVTSPPGGVGPDLTAADLPQADALVLFMAHPSRARLNMEWLDPAIIDEAEPVRAATLPSTPSIRTTAPRFPPSSCERYRAAQMGRNQRITRWAEQQLSRLEHAGHWPAGLDDLAFVVHGTSADLRFLDATIDASDRAVGTTLWGTPEVANYLPAGVESVHHAAIMDQPVVGRADQRECAAVAAQARDARAGGRRLGGHRVPAGHLRPTLRRGADCSAKRVVLEGATHYFEGQADLLRQACEAMVAW